MNYLSVCSGIEAATQAWHPLGWEPVAFSEIDKFPSAVLAHHYPDVPNLGDMTRYREWDVEPSDVDVLVGGTPCQSFSVAGLRKGLDDPRGNLALVYLGLVDRFRPRWVVWENVPGLLSSDEGRDFGAFLGGLAELGYGWAYRILDAQYVRVESHPRAVPQRRRRVFVVGHSGGWRGAAAVLSEREGMSGHSPPRRQAGEGASGRSARSLAIRGRDGVPQAELGDEVANAVLTPNGGRGGIGVGAVAESRGQDPVVATARETGKGFWTDDGTAGLRADPGGMPENIVAHSLRAEGFDASEDGTGRGTPLTPDVSPAIKARDAKGPSSDGDGDGAALVAFSSKDHGGDADEDTSPTLRAMSHDGSHANAGGQVAVAHSVCLGSDPIHARETAMPQTRRNGDPGVVQRGMAVRRLTPAECEALQGFPRGFTKIPYRGKPASKCPDGPRYRALGNSMACNVMRWLGERVALFEEVAAGLEGSE